MSRTSRLFELIGVLRARRLPVTAAELSAELGVSPRSVYRDIDTLRALGAPIEGQAGVGYRLGAGFFLPQLAFTQDELDVLALGLGWVRERGDPELVRSGESALAKIEAARASGAMPDGASPALLAAASLSRRADAEQVAVLRHAIGRQRKVAITYRDAAGTATERVIWPIAIVYFDEVRVLAAWCERRSAFRHFRVDRVAVLAVLDERYLGRRHALFVRWREQDRDWRSLLSISDVQPA
ncbi:YafY family transcriptional regulator [Sphingomonas sp. RRHST34]|uniref:YafY family transcriptional regulator n=1 Tax=Sphingomonas citri TaxID=2862499 RepID=A0ABS7BRI5_9SPHN|nr:YafY family protein [Sphingomonas citri]MBW6532077.1 YafY family transcriptional regulator [Sphingomonas citri]